MLADTDAWYSLTLASQDNAVIRHAALWVESNRRLLVQHTNDSDVLANNSGNLAETLRALSLSRTLLLHHPTATEYAGAAWAGKKLAANPDTDSTTWGYATLAGVTAQQYSDMQQGALDANDVGYYGAFKGNNITHPPKTMSGQYPDVIVLQDWVAARSEERVLALLIRESNANRKLPYDDTGIARIGNEVRGVLLQGENVKHFVRGRTRVTVPRLADIPLDQRQQRRVTITFEAELAGGIERVTVNGALVFELSA